MKSWNDFKKIRCQISTDSVSIDEKMYNEIQQDACTSINSKETNMTPEKLKPCPFCGEQNPILVIQRADNFITCKNCGCRTSSYPAKNIALFKWNTRTQSPEQGEPTVEQQFDEELKHIDEYLGIKKPTPSPTTKSMNKHIIIGENNKCCCGVYNGEPMSCNVIIKTIERLYKRANDGQYGVRDDGFRLARVLTTLVKDVDEQPRLKSMHTNNLLGLLTAPTTVGSGDLLDGE